MKKSRIFIIPALLFAMFFSFSVNPTSIKAQAGEGADVCVWYSANGYKDRASCDSWLAYKKAPYEQKYLQKILKCGVAAGYATVGIKKLEGTLFKLAPKVIIAEYGISFFLCMW